MHTLPSRSDVVFSENKERRMRCLLLLLILAAGLVPASAQAWSWPAEGRVLRPFEFGDDPYAAGQRRGLCVRAH